MSKPSDQIFITRGALLLALLDSNSNGYKYGVDQTERVFKGESPKMKTSEVLISELNKIIDKIS